MHESSRARRKTNEVIAITLHVSYGTAGILARSLKCQGFEVRAFHLYRGEKLPSIKDCAGVISLGGPMSVNDTDKHSWILDEQRFLLSAVDADLPVVGICLGGQLLARALGAVVGAASQPEVGWFPITLNDQGKQDPILSAAGHKPTVYHWHQDSFELPKHATALASSAHCEVQAFQLGARVYGFQFHPEIDHALVRDRFRRLGNTKRVLDLKNQFSSATNIQDPELHQKLALEYENSSLRIAAAITSVFRRKTFQSVPGSFKQMISSLRENHMDVLIKLRPNLARKINLRGRVVREFSSQGADFLILQEAHALLWAIRVDDIEDIQPTEGRMGV